MFVVTPCHAGVAWMPGHARGVMVAVPCKGGIGTISAGHARVLWGSHIKLILDMNFYKKRLTKIGLDLVHAPNR